MIGSTGRGNYGHGLDTVWREFSNTEVTAVADDNADGLAKAVAETFGGKINTPADNS